MLREIVIKHEFNIESREISSDTAMSLALQSLIYDSRPDRKWISKKIPKCIWFHPLVLPGSFQKMSKN